MVGWKRIVVTVGEKIGKTHLTYAQGASAEIVAMVTILAADHTDVPVSTTHVLSSGVAGTMAANGSGLQILHHSQHRSRLGLHPARRGAALREPLLALQLPRQITGFLPLGPARSERAFSFPVLCIRHDLHDPHIGMLTANQL